MGVLELKHAGFIELYSVDVIECEVCELRHELLKEGASSHEHEEHFLGLLRRVQDSLETE